MLLELELLVLELLLLLLLRLLLLLWCLRLLLLLLLLLLDEEAVLVRGERDLLFTGDLKYMFIKKENNFQTKMRIF